MEKFGEFERKMLLAQDVSALRARSVSRIDNFLHS